MFANSPDFRYDGNRQDGAHMELNDRIAFAGKAAGLTQEQLGARMGAAPRRSENGSPARPCRVLAAARLCQELHISADFLLLGQEPEVRSGEHPGTVPLCGEPVCGPICENCGYTAAKSRTEDGARYALVTTEPPRPLPAFAGQLSRYTGLSLEEASGKARSPQCSPSWYRQ